MRIAIIGSVATDHLKTYPGRFADSFMPDNLHRISASFLADGLAVRRGGVAANICYGMSQLGCPSVLVAAVGSDFAADRADFEAAAPLVDTSQLLVCDDLYTARFSCTTDRDQNQIGAFYPGAMARAREQSVAQLHAQEPLDVVVLSPNDPDAMRRHTRECQELGISYYSDPSQQTSSMPGDLIKDLVDGADTLFCNDYEAGLIADRTGWSDGDIMKRVRARVVTHGARGSMFEESGAEPISAGVVTDLDVADPTGGGDAFRAGYLSALMWGLAPQQRCEVGAVLASFALQAVGPQGYTVSRDEFVARMERTFGAQAAQGVRDHLPQ